MKAPKKIYLEKEYPDNRILPNGISYSQTSTNIEYTRTDTFIEKLECWMNENFYQYTGEFAEGILAQFDRTEDAIDSFKKYMEGE